MISIIYELMYLFQYDLFTMHTGVVFSNPSVRNGYVSKDNADSIGDSHHIKV